MGLGEGMNLDEELCRFCKSNKVLIKQFNRPPKGETNFGFLPYNRSLWRCPGCRHITNKHNFNIDTAFYKKTYQRTTYKEKARSRFTDLMSLPREQSDNRQRVNFIDNFWNDTQKNKEKSCLDVGSGLGVFPAVLKELNWDCVAIEPDPEACEIIREQIGIEVLSGDLIECQKIGEFNLICFNKVLEHTQNPKEMLLQSTSHLKSGGLLYIELPDGETALKESGPDREEFFVEHFDAYSRKSLELLMNSVRFKILTIDQVYEPSGKFTLRAFAIPL
ncbi:MAG: methyltransferase [Rhodospirillaceae bacterium]|nr:methyltransferase [Rhodospirillaceae bacterium]